MSKGTLRFNLEIGSRGNKEHIHERNDKTVLLNLFLTGGVMCKSAHAHWQ